MRHSVAAGGIMKKTVLSALCLLSAVAALSAPVPASAKTDVSVNVNLGPPPVVVNQPVPQGYPPPRFDYPEPSELVVIPRTTIYFAPGINVDLFFHNDWWWTRDNGRWYRSHEPRGGWVYVEPRRVPREIIRVRPDYRSYYGRERHVPYGQLKKHWREREIERRERRGEWRDWKEEKRDRKRHEKEMKREFKEERRGGKHDRDEGRPDDRGGHGRGRD
jgi:hypothetical protein